MANSPLWLPSALMLISAVMHAVTNGCLKASTDKLNTRTVTSLTYCLCGLPFAIWFGLPEPALYPYFALSMTVHFAYQLLQIATLRFGDLSAVYPISRGVAPILVAGGAILFLGEQIVVLKWIGLFIICLSIALFALEGGKGGGTSRRAIGLALAHGVTIAGYTLVDAAAVRLAEHPMVFVAWFFVLDGLALPIIQMVRQGNWLGKTARRDIRFGNSGGWRYRGLCHIGAVPDPGHVCPDRGPRPQTRCEAQSQGWPANRAVPTGGVKFGFTPAASAICRRR